jgi:GH25 family lysozyme M1 (1,4-beta-N-acetylmuramidase)
LLPHQQQPRHCAPGKPRPARRLLALALTSVAALTTLGIVVTAHALSPGPAALPAVRHPDDDHAGWSLHRSGASVAGGLRAAAAEVEAAAVGGAHPRGLDVSRWQGNVNWASVASRGARFAFVKATESTTYVSPTFAQQYNGSYRAGLIRGAYHFALPNRSSGTTQANFFVNHGGGWSRDGRTLPPVLDIEYNPYGAECYGLSRGAMVSWIRAFSNQVRARTGRHPAIYTTTDWWRACTGNAGGFASTNPLWIARYASSPGTLPAGWGWYTFWQYSDSGTFPGDQNVFNGSLTRLRALAAG